MATLFTDIFNDDAFTLTSLTNAVNNIDFVPGQAGALAFAGVGEGIGTTKFMIEMKNTALSIIPFSPRGAPAKQETRDKARVVPVAAQHIVLQETIDSDSVQDARHFGTGELETVQSVVNTQMAKMAARVDYTLEHMRLGALHGSVRDADGSEVLNLFDTFNVDEPAAAAFSATAGTLRPSVMAVKRGIEARAKILLPPGAQVVALCSPGFFDSFTKHADVTTAFANWEAAQANLAGDVRGGFTFGDVTWIEYRGSDAAMLEQPSSEDLIGEIGIVDGDCRFFLANVPGMFSEKYAPADNWANVNTIGLPRYAQIAVDQQFGKFAVLEVQSNPLPICTRPATLVRGHF